MHCLKTTLFSKLSKALFFLLSCRSFCMDCQAFTQDQTVEFLFPVTPCLRMPCCLQGPGQAAVSPSVTWVHHNVMHRFSASCSLLPQHKGNFSEIIEDAIAEDVDQYLLAVISMS